MSVDKNIIDVYTWNLPSGKTFSAYMAKWCEPCRNIKGHVMKYMDVDPDTVTTVDKEFYKKNINSHVPFFRFSDGQKIQTSNLTEWMKFMDQQY